MARVRLNGQVGLNLTGHIAAQVHLAECLVLVGQVQDHGTSELVVGHACPVGGLKDVDAVPCTGTLGAGCHP